MLAVPGNRHPQLYSWLEEVVELCRPLNIVLCDGSKQQADQLIEEMVQEGRLIPLNREKHPGSYLARSSAEDVARVESKTFICCDDEQDAGPTNHWRDPLEMRAHLQGLFKGCMRGRTCYIIPFCMGPFSSPLARLGVQVTDSAYVAVNMRLMTRTGVSIWQQLDAHPESTFTRALHSVGYPLSDGQSDSLWPCNPSKVCIAHFPSDNEIISYGSGYGGNALLGKKCLALRLASSMGRQEGWLAEHMLIIGVTDPKGRHYYFAAAFPSSCGKTNMAMMKPSLPGWKVECVGDDIAWMWVDESGQLRAVNPESGFFGVAPGTSDKTNPHIMQSLRQNALFTNVALSEGGEVWWEGLERPLDPLVDWQGRAWSDTERKAAHPNARFTVNIEQCPILDPHWNDPEGVPISAILFGGRRSQGMPLALATNDWTHGVLMGSALSSEMTAAAEGTAGQIRRDPFAMLPFCGYHMGDYFAHWLALGRGLKKKVPIFCINWFLRSDSGSLIWPGFGENIRVLKWMIDLMEGRCKGHFTPIGRLPQVDEIDWTGLDVDEKKQDALTFFDRKAWIDECQQLQNYLGIFNPRLPEPLVKKLLEIQRDLKRLA